MKNSFVKAAFTKLNSVSGATESEIVSQFFHILGSAEQQAGCVRAGGDRWEQTVYASCCNTRSGVYYYTTYYNRRITAVDLFAENLEEGRLLVASNRGFLPVEQAGTLPAESPSIRRLPIYKDGKPFLRNYCMFWKKDRSSYYIEEFAEILHRLLETA